MHNYIAPIKDMRFAMEELSELDAICDLPDFEGIDLETINAVMEEGGKFANEVLSPLNWEGDQKGTQMDENGVVQCPGFKEAYDQYVAGGWTTMPCDLNLVVWVCLMLPLLRLVKCGQPQTFPSRLVRCCL